ncbi:cysteine/serine-rich nuclear protein 1 [Dipodomys merriami]|uniref:cysteine/serine-rich nuclear protein 1 n=1 Tax=Dipodomys merriami TaxID=94247 RepID=UPI00384F53A0
MKRKFYQLEEEGDPSSCSSSSSSSSPPSCSSTSSTSPPWGSDEEPWVRGPQPGQDSCSPKSFTPLSILRRTGHRRTGRVAFEGVTVFYFPRCQGFTSVPRRGGCTLGMAPYHTTTRRFSLAEFTLEQARVRRERLRQRLREENVEAQRQKLLAAGLLREDWNPEPMVDEASVEEALEAAVAQGALEDDAFLQPCPARQRRALLRASGVRRIDRDERRELRALRRAREDCGCHCTHTCDPRTCSCSLAGIPCQMDHTSFPCGCARESCANPEGRVEFNQARVHTHFVRTLARLQLEQATATGDPGETEAPAGSHPPGLGEQGLLPPFLGGSSSSELEEDSRGSDMTDSSTASSSSSSLGETQGDDPAPPFQPCELWGEEEEEEEAASRDPLDHLTCFHFNDVFGAAHWPQSFAGSNLPPGIWDENANLDADSAPGAPPAQPGCDSLAWLQTLPDYSLGPRYPAPHTPPGGPTPGDLSPGFLDSLLGLSDPATEPTLPFDHGATSLVEPAPL